MRYTLEEMEGVTLAISPDGYVHHAMVNGNIKFPFERNKITGYYSPEPCKYKPEEIRPLLKNKQIVWG